MGKAYFTFSAWFQTLLRQKSAKVTRKVAGFFERLQTTKLASQGRHEMDTPNYVVRLRESWSRIARKAGMPASWTAVALHRFQPRSINQDQTIGLLFLFRYRPDGFCAPRYAASSLKVRKTQRCRRSSARMAGIRSNVSSRHS